MLIEMMLGEFDNEMTNTRKVLALVPADKFGWQPHEKSSTMGHLAAHLAMLPSMGGNALIGDSYDVMTPNAMYTDAKNASSAAELLELFDKNVATTRAALLDGDDEMMMDTWTLLAGTDVIFSLPRVAVMRTFFLNHVIHHRAQLEVYLRINDVPLPSIYGPTADQPM